MALDGVHRLAFRRLIWRNWDLLVLPISGQETFLEALKRSAGDKWNIIEDDTTAAEQTMDDGQVLRGIYREVADMNRRAGKDRFSITKMLASVIQMMALMALVWMCFLNWRDPTKAQQAVIWGIVTIALQLMALTFYVMHRTR